jgi:hypothetical protein
MDIGFGAPLTLSWLVVLSGAVIAGMVAWLRLAGWRDLADPILFYPVLLWIVFGAVVLVDPENPGNILGRLTEDQLKPAYYLVLVGIACFMVAYAAIAKPTPQITISLDSLKRLKRGRILMVVGLVFGARLGLAAFGNLGYIFNPTGYQSTVQYTGLLNIFVELQPFLLLLLALLAFSKIATRRDRVLFVGVLLIELGIGLISGTKSGLVLPTVSVCLGYLYARGRLPWRVLGVGLLVFLFLVPGIERYRELLNEPGQRVSSPIDALGYGGQAAREVWAEPNVGERVTDGYSFMVGRLNELRAFTLIREMTPEPVPYEMGRNYLVAPLFNVVPRILWPGKPILDIGAQTARIYHRIPEGTSITRTILGDFYANFGVLGIVAGMALFGAVTAALRRRFVTAKTVTMLFVYAVAFFVLLDHEGDFASIVAGLPRTLVFVLALAWFVAPGDWKASRRQAETV